MAGLIQTALPGSEPVSLNQALDFLRLPANNTSPLVLTSDEATVELLITAAREYIEDCTGLMLAPRAYVQSLDSFPFYPYSREPYGTLYGVGALSLYFGYGPILPTPIPPYGMNQNGNLPFQIVLLGNPVTAVDRIVYIGTDGEPHTLLPGRDFVADMTSFPARVTPLPGQVWPQCTLGANCVQVFFTSGFATDPTTIETVSDTDDTTQPDDVVPDPPQQQASFTFVSGIPQKLVTAILLLVSHWYFNRDAVVAGNAMQVPHSLQAIIETNKVLDFTLGITAAL
jgi:hypothetical protein